MHSTSVFKASGVAALLLLAGCSSSTTKPEQYSGFLKDYSGLEKTTSSTGKPVMRWVAPGFNLNNYDSIVYNPVVYYPTPKPTAQISQKVLDGLLNYTNDKLKTAAASRKPLVTTPGPRSVIFRGAITAVDSSKEGLQFYEVLPIALVVAGTEVATGHRTMDTSLFFEGELIDAATQKTVVKVVRKGEGKDLNNEKTPLTVDNLKQVIDDMATDARMFDPAPK
ncbi:DUF3313 domain-containing protein [Cronobacter sakazakii]|uniref:DUF3313 domain-containing protein n=4 Tax=Cronobacter sakazakii TaxID=28141 RepID=A7MLE9_CROS8|nr:MULTISPECIES: DUF3313 domain-containing protein [Cronobacter]ABU76976.1 hypothetical protein ESA_01722 [Cronobacter sakazakii ATCC BAA-894]AXX02204.1 DUF3313 domain-containing protein [Cronobacter sakazakii]EGT4320409.1 DUF3313 domain-containing protein [Cronobacter sakazakii]EGT4353775.1 DUF3313 domain-containing protein [Cronobacter sakazakii]EGT4510956.1 DUF3313 domain-containing protein [Cronobacter sakazakii]